jgi:hypothetical protein
LKKLVIAIVLLGACNRAVPPSRPEAAPARPFHRSDNLVGLVRGGSVVFRTGEAMPTTSPVRAIDGDPATRWVSLPHDVRQQLVYALPARANFTGIALHTGSKPGASTSSFDVALSDDGRQFVSAGEFPLPKEKNSGTFAVKPAAARFVRLTPLTSSGSFSTAGEFEVRGSYLEPAVAGAIDGCWTIDGLSATFVRQGASVSGFLGDTENATLDGGVAGALFRFAWIRGREYGLAAVTVAPDGRTLSGMVWHEQAIAAEKFLANDWLGERKPGSAACPPLEDATSVFRAYIGQRGYYPLYGLRFDDAGNLDRAASEPTLARVTAMLAGLRGRNIRFVAHELLQPTPEANRAMTQREIDTLRAALNGRGADLAHVAFAAAGDQHPRREPTTELTRAMYSVVELEVAR